MFRAVDSIKEENLEKWKVGGYVWEVTEKVFGTGSGFSWDNQENNCGYSDNLVGILDKNTLEENLEEIGRNFTFLGEVIGEGIQGNKYKLKGQEFYLYDIYDIDRQTYIEPITRKAIAKLLEIKHVPHICDLKLSQTATMEDILIAAEGDSRLKKGVQREGLVFKNHNDPNTSFKVISNKWLLKNE